MNRFKLFFVLRSGIILIFLASLISPATEALAAPIESKSSISCLPGMSCFFGFSCGEGGGDNAVGVRSSSGAVPCSHRVRNISSLSSHSDKNVQASSSADPAGANAQETGSSLPSAGGSHAVPSLPAAGNIESDSKQNSGLTLEDSMSRLENEARSFKTTFSEVPGFWNPPTLEFSAQSSGKSKCFEYGERIIKAHTQCFSFLGGLGVLGELHARIDLACKTVDWAYSYCGKYYPKMRHNIESKENWAT
ncbi:hypothetical protein FB446DRAFT_707611 [Lentinula raphanica]|nr:hypothetical protein FB446DRAFT_707611 [Lentinula raphanica]